MVLTAETGCDFSTRWMRSHICRSGLSNWKAVTDLCRNHICSNCICAYFWNKYILYLLLLFFIVS
ncbi:hypothetical protein RchiOBHm_Chr5g0013831 [Rosa chinensis]|uniref:Uncharacterized protein n=1 Tax=Rosa chinensis TaxID=74649 RepID=A0A2P6Q5H5_ROSCH|nr:hypothetical protein RchiOBHm_Chr5g0013831 [Rosa chinensis]